MRGPPRSRPRPRPRPRFGWAGDCLAFSKIPRPYGDRGGGTSGERDRIAVVVDVHVGELGLGDLDDLIAVPVACRLDGHLDRDRGASQLDQLGVERHQVADKHRLVEHHLVHGHGDHPLSAPYLGPLGARKVDVGEDHTAEDRAVGVGVPRHHHDPLRRLPDIGGAHRGSSSWSENTPITGFLGARPETPSLPNRERERERERERVSGARPLPLPLLFPLPLPDCAGWGFPAGLLGSEGGHSIDGEQQRQHHRHPCTDQRWQVVGLTHLGEHGYQDDGVPDTENQGHGNALHGGDPLAAPIEGEWQGQKHHDEGRQRMGELAMETDPEPGGPVSRAEQLIDVDPQLVEGHLLGLAILMNEVVRPLRDADPGGSADLFVLVGSVGVDVSEPSSGVRDPLAVEVANPVSVEMATQSEITSLVPLEPEHCDPEHGLAGYVETHEAVEGRSVSGHEPDLVGGMVGAGCLPALDTIEQPIGLPFAAGEDGLFEHPQSCGNYRGNHEHRNHETIQGDAGSFQGGQLALAFQHAEQNEHRDHQCQRSHINDGLRQQVPVVADDHIERGPVLGDLVDMIREVDDDVERRDADEHQGKRREQAAHEVAIKQGREAIRITAALQVYRDRAGEDLAIPADLALQAVLPPAS